MTITKSMPRAGDSDTRGERACGHPAVTTLRGYREVCPRPSCQAIVLARTERRRA